MSAVEPSIANSYSCSYFTADPALPRPGPGPGPGAGAEECSGLELPLPARLLEEEVVAADADFGAAAPDFGAAAGAVAAAAFGAIADEDAGAAAVAAAVGPFIEDRGALVLVLPPAATEAETPEFVDGVWDAPAGGAEAGAEAVADADTDADTDGFASMRQAASLQNLSIRSAYMVGSRIGTDVDLDVDGGSKSHEGIVDAARAVKEAESYP